MQVGLWVRAQVWGPLKLDHEQAGIGSPFVGPVPPESPQCLSLRQGQEEKDSLLPCDRHPSCAEKVNAAPYLRVDRSLPTSRCIGTACGTSVSCTDLLLLTV